MDKPIIAYPIVVEGKYDKIKITSLFCADVIVTDGFGVFRREDKVAFFKKLAQKTPIIILADSDGAGTVIRRYFLSILPKDRQIHIYTPEIFGKEKRKIAPSKSGRLGVEGMDGEVLRRILAPYIVSDDNDCGSAVRPRTAEDQITKADMYAVGLSGGPGSAEARRALAQRLELPLDISATALLTALGLLYTREEFFEIMGR